MLKFVILSSNDKNIKGYKNIITEQLFSKIETYECHSMNNIEDFISHLNQKIKNNIYIIENTDMINIQKIMKIIRNDYNDYSSYIIIVDPEGKVTDLEYFVKNIVINSEDNAKTKLAYIVKELLKCEDYDERKITVKKEGIIYKIPCNDVLYIEKENNSKYCKIICKKNEYRTKRTLLELKEELGKGFIQTHKSACVNLECIKYYDKASNTIIFENDDNFDLISRDKRKDLVNALTKEVLKTTL